MIAEIGKDTFQNNVVARFTGSFRKSKHYQAAYTEFKTTLASEKLDFKLTDAEKLDINLEARFGSHAGLEIVVPWIQAGLEHDRASTWKIYMEERGGGSLQAALFTPA